VSCLVVVGETTTGSLSQWILHGQAGNCIDVSGIVAFRIHRIGRKQEINVDSGNGEQSGSCTISFLPSHVLYRHCHGTLNRVNGIIDFCANCSYVPNDGNFWTEAGKCNLRLLDVLPISLNQTYLL
jgi:hypothetical protein